MKQFVTKYSRYYFMVIVALLVGAFVGSDGFQWFQWLFIAIAVAMAAYYMREKIEG